MIDLSLLAPAPWVTRNCHVFEPGDECVANCNDLDESLSDDGGRGEAHAEFIALARNAFDVMMRRGWYAVKCQNNWMVRKDGIEWSPYLESPSFLVSYIPVWPDPFTALVEADKWYKEKMEAPVDDVATPG